MIDFCEGTPCMTGRCDSSQNSFHFQGDVEIIDKIKKNEMGGVCGTYGMQERGIQGLVGRPEGKGPLGRPKCRCEDNIKIFIQELECEA